MELISLGILLTMQMAVTLGSQVGFSEAYRDVISLTSGWVAKGLPFSHVFFERYGEQLGQCCRVLPAVSTHKASFAIAGGGWVHLQGWLRAAACIA